MVRAAANSSINSTNRDIISEISESIRAKTPDDRVSNRYILSKLINKTSFYIKRENDLFRLFDYDNIWYTIDCVSMEEANVVECCGGLNIKKCNSTVRSVYELPAMYSYRNGPVIREVRSLDMNIIYKPTTPLGYKKILDREFRNKDDKYYWFENNKIVIPDSNAKLISITAYFQNLGEARRYNSECNNDELEPYCISPLDEEFQCPNHLKDLVIEETERNILERYKRVVTDNNFDDDNNNKTGIINDGKNSR